MTIKILALLIALAGPAYAATPVCKTPDGKTHKVGKDAPANCTAAKAPTKPAKVTKTSKAKKPAAVMDAKPASIETSSEQRLAFAACESAVRSVLKVSPDATFPETEIKANRIDPKRFAFAGAVDSKASSGVLYRKRFTCEAQHDGRGWHAH